ncbi:MAG: rane protein [Chloroflexi bacterium]|nr:rane protein [Chloroflexota bacterium]
MPWFIWLVIAVLALAGETVSTAFVLVYIGVAAAITAVLAALGLPFVLQIVVFIPLTLALLSLVRPRTLSLLHGHAPRRQISSDVRMVDRVAVVEHEVTDDAGMVRLGSGEFWTARAYPPGERIQKGCSVRIMFVEGLTVYVSLPTESGSLPEITPGIASVPPEETKEGA